MRSSLRSAVGRLHNASTKPIGTITPKTVVEAPLRLPGAPARRLGLRELALYHGDQSLILLQAEHEVDAVRLAPRHRC